jgi:hypothetical protein
MGSPDDADAANLAYYEGGFSAPEVVVPHAEQRSFEPHYDSAQRRRGYYGRT